MLKIYSKKNCPACVKAKSILESKDIAYEEIPIDSDEDARNFIIGEGHRTVPQLYVGMEQFVNSFMELQDMTEEEILTKIKELEE